MIKFWFTAATAVFLSFLELGSCNKNYVSSSLDSHDPKLPIGEILADRFNNANLTTLPENEALWDILRLPKGSIADSQIIDHLLGVFGSDENQWFLQWALGKKVLSGESQTLAKFHLAEAQIRHGLKMKEYGTIRDILGKHKHAISYYFEKKEVQGYANYLLDQIDSESSKSDLDFEDFHNFYRQFSFIDLFLISPKTPSEFLIAVLPKILNSSDEFISLANGISYVDLSQSRNSNKTMGVIHNRNSIVFKKVKSLLKTWTSKYHLSCLEIVNDILFLSHSSTKTEQVLAKFEHIKHSKQVDFSSQPFYHHSAINMDEPEIFEAVEALFPRYQYRRGGDFYMKYYMKYSGPKWRCFERLSDEKLEKYLDFDGAQFRKLVSGGMDRSDASILSRGKTLQNFEKPKLLFRSYGGKVPSLIVGTKRSELQTENLKYLLSTTDIPIARVFKYVRLTKNDPQFLIPCEIGIKSDRLLELLDYCDQDAVTDLLSTFEKNKVDLLLKIDKDTPKRLKYLNYILNSDSGFRLLMKHRPSLVNVLRFNFQRAVDGLPFHKVRRFFKFIGAMKTGCAAKPIKYSSDQHSLSQDLIKISTFVQYQFAKSEIDLLPTMGYILFCQMESAYSFTTFAKNIGLYEIWFQENPMSMLHELHKSKITQSYLKHRFTPEQFAAIRNGTDSSD